MEKIIIKLPYIQQEAFIGFNIFEKIIDNIDISKYDKFLVVVDNLAYNKNKGYLEVLFSKINVDKTNIIIIKPKPKFKDIKRAQKIIKHLIKIKASRNTCLIAIGGGYVGDLVGFVSSIYMRGVDFIQIPTTLMSQCDGVIGKVAVNFLDFKNLLGSFYSPKYIICDIRFMNSFSFTEQLYGLVEIWKHALIVNDLNIISKINKYLNKEENIDYELLIKFSLSTKKHFVEIDPFDKNGQHKALSLGHTIANVLESNPSFRHGLAVFYGIIFESTLSNDLSLMSSLKYNEILYTASLFESNFKRFNKIKNILNRKSILNILKFDKINSHNTYSFVLPTEEGFIFYKNISIDVLNKTFINFNNLPYHIHSI